MSKDLAGEQGLKQLRAGRIPSQSSQCGIIQKWPARVQGVALPHTLHSLHEEAHLLWHVWSVFQDNHWTPCPHGLEQLLLHQRLLASDEDVAYRCKQVRCERNDVLVIPRLRHEIPVCIRGGTAVDALFLAIEEQQQVRMRPGPLSQWMTMRRLIVGFEGPIVKAMFCKVWVLGILPRVPQVALQVDGRHGTHHLRAHGMRVVK
mmetsp:Transcript_76130/g.150537  ORF Transcript_76130/g.150537 Transcript_76130/m.150537 type:complete len:204 (+) Transcript_76130:550-1161(+)